MDGMGLSGGYYDRFLPGWHRGEMRRYWEADALETDRRHRHLLLGYPLYPHLVMLSSAAVSEQRNGK